MRSMNGSFLFDSLYSFKLTVGLPYIASACCNSDDSCRCKNFFDGRGNQHFLWVCLLSENLPSFYMASPASQTGFPCGRNFGFLVVRFFNGIIHSPL